MNQISEDKNFLQDIHNIITFFYPCDRQYLRNSYFSLKCDRFFVPIWDSLSFKAEDFSREVLPKYIPFSSRILECSLFFKRK